MQSYLTEMQYKGLYFPEVLHGGKAPESGDVSVRQWHVEEELRHDFGVVVHVSAHHPIRYYNTFRQNRKHSETDKNRSSHQFISCIFIFFLLHFELERYEICSFPSHACFSSKKALGVFDFFPFLLPQS